MMTKFEHDFLTNTWDGPKGAAYNQVYEFCKAFGWMKGFDPKGQIVLTNKGKEAVRAYQSQENYKRIDVI